MLGTVSAFAYRHRETKKNLCRGGRSQDLPNTNFVEGGDGAVIMKLPRLGPLVLLIRIASYWHCSSGLKRGLRNFDLLINCELYNCELYNVRSHFSWYLEKRGLILKNLGAEVSVESVGSKLAENAVSQLYGVRSNYMFITEGGLACFQNDVENLNLREAIPLCVIKFV